MPEKFQSSHINTLAAAMVADAESNLGQICSENEEKDYVTPPFQVFEGGKLQAAYTDLTFPHGKERMKSWGTVFD